jgi:hypothetical protein
MPSTDAVSLVEIAGQRFVHAPARLRRRMECVPLDAVSVSEALGDDLVDVIGEARLAYGDEATLHLVATDGVETVDDADPRLAALRAAADPLDWREAPVDEPGARRFGAVEDGALVASANVRVWAATIAHLGIFTASHARRRGLAARVGSAAAQYSLEVGCVPQWRSRMSNVTSAGVAERLGFVVVGRQLHVLVRATDA